MDRSLYGHALLAVAAAGLALAAWKSPRDTTGSQAVIIGGDAERLSRVSWRDEGYQVSVARRGEAVEVTTQTLTKPATNETAPSTEPVALKPARVYPGTEEAKALFGKLMPLKAGRSLGVLPADKLAGLGLTEPKLTLTLQLGDTAQVIKLGETVFGTGDFYVQSGDGEVFLLPADRVAALRHGGGTLVDRNLTGVAEAKLRSFRVQGAFGTRSVQQQPAPGGGMATYVDAEAPDIKLETTREFLARLLRLRVVEQVEAVAAGEPLLSLELLGEEGGALGSFKVYPHTEKLALVVTPRFALPVTVSKSEADLLVREAGTLAKEGK